jgi:hypothetical protein
MARRVDAFKEVAAGIAAEAGPVELEVTNPG